MVSIRGRATLDGFCQYIRDVRTAARALRESGPSRGLNVPSTCKPRWRMLLCGGCPRRSAGNVAIREWYSADDTRQMSFPAYVSLLQSPFQKPLVKIRATAGKLSHHVHAGILQGDLEARSGFCRAVLVVDCYVRVGSCFEETRNHVRVSQHGHSVRSVLICVTMTSNSAEYELGVVQDFYRHP